MLAAFTKSGYFKIFGENEIWKSPFPTVSGFSWDSSYLYFPTKTELIKWSFDGSIRDTVVKWSELRVVPRQTLKIENKILIPISDPDKAWLRCVDIDNNTFSDFYYGENGGNLCWANSINLVDDSLYMVSSNYGWSSLLKLDPEKYGIIDRINNIGFSAHGIWKKHDKLWTLSSTEGYLKSIETSPEIVNIGQFVRGVAVSNNFIYVGTTPSRHSFSLKDASPELLPSPILSEPISGIVVLQKNNLKYNNLYKIRDSEEIYNIQLLSEENLAYHLDKDTSPRFLPIIDIPRFPEKISIFITGPHCSGKSTLSKQLEEELQRFGYTIFLIDEEDVETEENISHFMSLALSKYSCVIAAFFSPDNKKREKVRSVLSKVSSFYEVFIDTPLEVCKNRDVENKHFVENIEYQKSDNAIIVSGTDNIVNIARHIVLRIGTKNEYCLPVFSKS